MKTALISGISGQDGSYLAELLLQKGYEVHGIIRRHSTPSTSRIDHVFDQLHLHYGDLTDATSLSTVMQTVCPDEIYALGAQSHVRASFDVPVYTADVDALGTLRLLEAARVWAPEARFYQASSSEMFGSSPAPQNEDTPFHPRSPYGVSKVFSYYATVNYRESYDMFACNGILFNHESARRGETFVTRKITRAVARIANRQQDKLFLGNLDAKRDWGYAPEYVEGMWHMLQRDTPSDYVLATGLSWTVREFLQFSFEYVGLDWKKFVEIDPKYFRPAEVDVLKGDASKAKALLGWQPTVMAPELAGIMVKADLEAL